MRNERDLGADAVLLHAATGGSSTSIRPRPTSAGAPRSALVYLDVQDTRDLWYLNQSFAHGWLGDTPGFNGDLDCRAALDQGDGAVHLQR